MFGTSSVDAVPAAIVELPQEVTLRTVRRVAGVAEVEEVAYERAARDERLEGLPHLALDPASFEVANVAYDATPEVDPVASTLTDAELAYLGVGRFSGKGGSLSVIGNVSTRVAGAAGETTSMLRSLGVEPVVMADRTLHLLAPHGLLCLREQQGHVERHEVAQIHDDVVSERFNEHFARAFHDDRITFLRDFPREVFAHEAYGAVFLELDGRRGHG